MSNLMLKKGAFIHIPKCGGTFVQSLMWRFDLVEFRYKMPQYGHLYIHQMKNLENKYTFAFVRHPYTWWPSYYNWCKKDRFIDVEKLCPTFDEWLKDYGPFWMGQFTRLVQRYIGEDPLYPSTKKIDFVGKTETILEDTFTAIRNSGEDVSEKKYWQFVNNHLLGPNVDEFLNRQEYDRDISDASKEIIYNAERYIFDRFKYSKNGP